MLTACYTRISLKSCEKSIFTANSNSLLLSYLALELCFVVKDSNPTENAHPQRYHNIENECDIVEIFDDIFNRKFWFAWYHFDYFFSFFLWILVSGFSRINSSHGTAGSWWRSGALLCVFRAVAKFGVEENKKDGLNHGKNRLHKCDEDHENCKKRKTGNPEL